MVKDRKEQHLRLLGGIAAILLIPVLVQAENFRSRGSEETAQTRTASTVSDVQAELKFGENVAARILGRYPSDVNSSLAKYVNLVGNAVAIHADRPELTYRFAILNTDSINAYAAPGGYIFVTRGAINSMQDESELAGVLAHEVAHVTRRHIVNALNIRGNESGAQSSVSRFLSGAGEASKAAFSQVVDKAVDMLFKEGLQKTDEFEADKVGTVYLAAVGYDAVALQRFLDRIRIKDKKHLEIVNKTHPPFNERIEALRQHLLALGLTGTRSPRVEKRFRQHVKN